MICDELSIESKERLVNLFKLFKIKANRLAGGINWNNLLFCIDDVLFIRYNYKFNELYEQNVFVLNSVSEYHSYSYQSVNLLVRKFFLDYYRINI